MNRIGISILIIFTTALLSCGENEPEENQTAPQLPTKEETIEMNREWLKQEEQYVQNFLKNHPDWKMTKTGTGLRYFIYEEGEGEKAEPGKYATVEYEIKILGGDTVLYSSKESGPITFLIEQDYIETGMHEAITYMRVGDRAKVILMPHLAHGLLGDMNKIPPYTTLVFDVKLIRIS